MRKKHILILALILSVVLAMTVFALCASADAGDNKGVYDFGGGSGDSDDDFDLFGLLGWVIYLFADAGPVGIAIIIIFIIVAIIASASKKGKNTYVQRPAATMQTPAQSLNDIGSLKSKDPNFSEADLTGMISNLYIRLQYAWMAKNLEEMRPYLSDPFYSRLDSQLDTYRREGTTNMMEHPAVLSVSLRGWKTSNDIDSLIVSLRTRAVDYVKRDSDGSIVSGSKTAEVFMEYEWEMTRSSSVKTGDQKEQVVHNCPNCGAPLNINRTAKCEYCGSIVTVKEFDWLLNSIKTISQQTVGK